MISYRQRMPIAQKGSKRDDIGLERDEGWFGAAVTGLVGILFLLGLLILSGMFRG